MALADSLEDGVAQDEDAESGRDGAEDGADPVDGQPDDEVPSAAQRSVSSPQGIIRAAMTSRNKVMRICTSGRWCAGRD